MPGDRALQATTTSAGQSLHLGPCSNAPVQRVVLQVPRVGGETGPEVATCRAASADQGKVLPPEEGVSLLAVGAIGLRLWNPGGEPGVHFHIQQR